MCYRTFTRRYQKIEVDNEVKLIDLDGESETCFSSWKKLEVAEEALDKIFNNNFLSLIERDEVIIKEFGNMLRHSKINLCEEGEKLVGFIDFDDVEENEGFIFKFYIKEEPEDEA